MTKPTDPPSEKPDTPASTVPQTVEELTKGLKLLNKTLETEKVIKDSVQARIELIKNSLGNEEKLDEILKGQNATLDEINQQYELVKKNQKTIIDSSQILQEYEDRKHDALKQQFKINQETYILLLKEIEEAKKDEVKNKQVLELLEERRKEYQEILKTQAKQIESAERYKKVKEEILSVGKQLVQNLIGQTSELDKHIVNISKLNGGYAEYEDKLREANTQIYQATAGTGIMAAEANAAFSELSKNFIGLTTQNQEGIKQMVVGVAELTKVGVSATAAAKGIDTLVNSMGKTPEQAYKIQESFTQMAAKNRLALSAVSQAFADNSSRLVGYGEQMTKVLQGLAEQSLKTGVAINNLIKIAQGFDTFEDASRKVGNLNALLGGDYFNSIEMLTASDEERIKLLKEGILNSGLQWESMNRFQQMALANAAGINDLNEASKIFGKTSLENTKQQAESAAVQKTLAEQAKSVSTALEKMQSIMNGIIIALSPVIQVLYIVTNLFSGFINFFTEFGKIFGEFGGKVGTVVGSLILLFTVWTAKNLLLTGSFGNIFKTLGSLIKRFLAYRAAKKAAMAADVAPTPPLANITKIPQEGTRLVSTVAPPAPGAPIPPTAPGVPPAANATGGLLANAGNMLKAAGAILLFAAAILVLAIALQQFSSVEWEGMKKALVSVSALIGLSFLLQKASPAITSGIVVMVLMSASLLILGLALQMFSKVDWKILAGVGVIILGLGLAIAGLGAAVSGPQGAFLALGKLILIGIAVALTILGVAIKLIVDSIKDAGPAFTNLTDSLTKLFEIKDLKENFSNLESFFSQLSNIDVNPINNLAIAIGSLAENLQKLASLSSEMSLTVTGNAQTVVDQTLNQAASTVARTSEAISAASAARSQTLIPAAQTTAFVPVIVQVDKKTIIDILSGDMQVIAEGAIENYFGQVASGVKSAAAIQSLVSDVLAK